MLNFWLSILRETRVSRLICLPSASYQPIINRIFPLYTSNHVEHVKTYKPYMNQRPPMQLRSVPSYLLAPLRSGYLS